MDSRQTLSRIARIGVLTLFAVASVAPPVVSAGGPQLAFGVEMARRGLWNEALFRFRQALSENPGDARILNNLAVAYEAVGLFDEALEHYQKAVKVDPGNAQLKRNYARFVEFYQSFRPEDPKSEGEEEAKNGESGAEEPEEGNGS
jgi:Tfp pilus assembly protein PilF